MKRHVLKDDPPCEYCGSVEYDISATLIVCADCGATYGRCNGEWRLDPDTIPDPN